MAELVNEPFMIPPLANSSAAQEKGHQLNLLMLIFSKDL